MRILGTARWSRLIGTGVIVGGMTVASVVLTSTAAVATPAAASGTITCSKVTGTVKYTPPLTDTPGTVKMSVSLKLAKCVVTPPASGGDVTARKGCCKNSATSTVTLTGGCSELTGGTGVSSTWKVTWTKPKAPKTVVNFSGFAATTNGSGDFGLSYPESGGTGTATGSYAESGVTQQLFFNMTPAQISTACASPSGLADNGVENNGSTY
jgi:hypothetical protein